MSDSNNGSWLLVGLAAILLMGIVVANPNQTAETTQQLTENQIKVTYTGTNLAPLTAFMTGANVPLTPTTNDYAWYDDIVTHSGNPSIRVVAGGSTTNGEVDGPWVPVAPGDHVYIEMWVKTSTFSSADIHAGSFFGFDFYGHTPEFGFTILGDSVSNQAGHPTCAEMDGGYAHGSSSTRFGLTIDGANSMTQVAGHVCRVPFDNDWTLIQWDFTVPTRTWNYGWNGSAMAACTATYIDYMVCWLGVNNNGSASDPIWFSSPVLYVNPTTEDVVNTPSFNPIAGTYGAAQNVAISCSTSGAAIYYTTDDTTPDAGDNLYSAPIAVASSTILNAIGIKAPLTDSNVARAVYVINSPNTPSLAAVLHNLRLRSE